MTNHRLEFALDKRVKCLECGDYFIPMVSSNIWDRMNCSGCNYKENKRIVGIDPIHKDEKGNNVKMDYDKPPLKRQSPQHYQKITSYI